MPTTRPSPAARGTANAVAALARALVTRRATVAVAESCTGGLLGAALTARSGSSAYFRGGVLAYANAAKTRLLGVTPATLARHGAVSEPVARQMARAACRRLTATFGIAITGIAGPTGGTPRKPVGTVWLALAGPRGCRAQCLHLHGTRTQIRAQAVRAALALLQRFL
jgi:PncC family amidohydrolase